MPSCALIAVPVPLVPVVSTKYSAADIVEPPVPESETDAPKLTLVAPTVGFGLDVRLLVIGPKVSPLVSKEGSLLFDKLSSVTNFFLLEDAKLPNGSSEVAVILYLVDDFKFLS